jgi:RNA polymerase subunit RPABC4/transcription elongation factor Spt4
LAQTSLEVGEFQANAQAIGPNCSSSSTTLGWASGTLVMTKASATQMAGTITMKDAAGGTTTGTFSIPSCTKTLAEIGSSVSTCVP